MRIVMDDAGDVPADVAEKYNIIIVPINIMFGTEQFLSGISMDHDAFYEKVKTVGAHNFPKTSQPTPYQFAEIYKSILAEGESEVLTITVSEKLSGTYASAVAAGRELVGQGTFHLYDSQAGSAGQGLMAIEAARMAADGHDYAAIKARLDEMLQSQSIYFLIDSLEYAVKGGRVSSMRSTMATLLNIKPIMTLKDGIITEAGKVRTYNKALAYMIDAVKADVGDKPVKLAVMHGGAEQAGRSLLEMARSSFNITEEYLVNMAISVAINLGPGALGLVAIPEVA
ncbi:MAG: DegV family protein [Ardenticatenaceae bacterium]|nr:DegV family protein [Anaerolineales bacterium]MCB8918798.1 DegV family protein [Ardenticatenaceae bacterium]